MIFDGIKDTAKGTAKGSFLSLIGAGVAYFVIKAWQKGRG